MRVARSGQASLGSTCGAVALFALAACSDLLGFQRGGGGGCDNDGDCAERYSCISRVCALRCTQNEDCTSATAPVCVANRCVTTAEAGTTGEGVQDSGEGTAPSSDSGAVQSDALGEPDTSSANDAPAEAGCALACAPLTECRGGACVQGGRVPPFETGDSGYGLPTNAMGFCVQIEIMTCGDLTGVGVVLNSAANAAFRFAVYSDVGGSPVSRLAQTQAVAVNGITVDAPVDPVVTLGNRGGGPSAYWLCLATTAFGVEIEVNPGARSRWDQMAASPVQVSDWVKSGLPTSWSQPNTADGPTPIAYLWLVPLPP